MIMIKHPDYLSKRFTHMNITKKRDNTKVARRWARRVRYQERYGLCLFSAQSCTLYFIPHASPGGQQTERRQRMACCPNPQYPNPQCRHYHCRVPVQPAVDGGRPAPQPWWRQYNIHSPFTSQQWDGVALPGACRKEERRNGVDCTPYYLEGAASAKGNRALGGRPCVVVGVGGQREGGQ